MAQFPLRLPQSLMSAVRTAAAQDGASINQFIITAAAEKISALLTEDYLNNRADKANLKSYRKALSKVPASGPIYDEDKL
jgi:uncharacterized protein (DUF1778 family)